jgi:hypothetical protein
MNDTVKFPKRAEHHHEKKQSTGCFASHGGDGGRQEWRTDAGTALVSHRRRISLVRADSTYLLSTASFLHICLRLLHRGLPPGSGEAAGGSLWKPRCWADRNRDPNRGVYVKTWIAIIDHDPN